MRLLTLIALMSLAVSCHQIDNTYQKLEQIDAMLYEECDNVADSLLSSIKREELNNKEKSMYFNL